MQLTQLSALLFLLPLTLAAAAPKCFVILPLIYTLDYPFTLVVQNNTRGDIHNHAVNYIPLGTPGEYRSVIAPLGTPHKLNITDSLLTFSGEKFTAYLRVPIKTVYRQVTFVTSPNDALEVVATYGCDEKGRQQMELSPYVDEGPALSMYKC